MRFKIGDKVLIAGYVDSDIYTIKEINIEPTSGIVMVKIEEAIGWYKPNMFVLKDAIKVDHNQKWF